MTVTKITSFIIVLILFFLTCSNKEGQNPVEPGDEAEFLWLSTSGNKIINSKGNQALLYGVNRSGLEYDKQGNNMSEAEFNYICNEWQAKVIRLPFNQDWIMNDDGYNNKLDQVIGWIKKNGAYVILDLQWQDTQIKIPRIPNSEAVQMWKKLAQRYKDDAAILYDIHNEAHDVSIQEWRLRASEIVEGIQSVNPKALLLVSGLNWSSDVSEWARNPLPYSNIVYSVHVYPWLGNKSAWNTKFGNYSDELPMFVGEFGGYSENITWGKELIAYLNQKQLGWTAWSWVDDPHLTQENHTTPTEFGNLVKQILVRYAFPEQYMNNISNVTVDYITTNRVTINWRTKNDSDAKVFYGLTVNYSDSVYSSVFLKSHTIKLINLSAGTVYHFKVVSMDDLGFFVETSDSTFSTKTL